MKKLTPLLLVCLAIMSLTGCASTPATSGGTQVTIQQLKPAIEATRAILRLGLPILAQSRGVSAEAVSTVLIVVDPLIDSALYGGEVNMLDSAAWKTERDAFVAKAARAMTTAHYTDKKSGVAITPFPDEAMNAAIVGPMIDQLAIQVQALAKNSAPAAPVVLPVPVTTT